MWEQLQPIIEALYIEREANRFDVHINTLQEAYINMTQFWNDNFRKLCQINYIIIGECPLWGLNQNYIYNSNVNPTRFLTANDINHIFEPLVPIRTKTELLRLINEHGILIIDAFPYALNDTVCLNYRFKGNRNGFSITKNQYRNLARTTFQHHLQLLLERILNDTRLGKNAKLFFRYSRVNDALRPLVTNLNNGRIQITNGHLGLRNGILNRQLLTENL